MSEKHSINHDLIIKSSVSEVFNALTQPKKLVDWWPLRCTGSAKLSAVYNFYFSDEFNWYGKVIECQTNELFTVEMTQADEDWDKTQFGFNLEQKSNQTLLRFNHTGWKNCNHEFRKTSFCWAILLKGLKNYLEEGIIIPYEDRS